MIKIILSHFLTGNIFRRHSCNLHSYVLQCSFDLIINNICISYYKNTDTSATVNIRYNYTILCCYFLKSSDIKVLTNNCDLLYESIFYSLCCISFPCLSHECIHICCIRIYNLIYYCFYKSLELIVLSNEVCLRVYFYDCCYFIIFNYSLNDTFCCNSSSFLLSFSLSVLSQEFNGCIHISICLGECFFAVHHSCTCHFS